MPNDPVKDSKRHRPFQVQLKQGKTYVIELRSTEMDSYLCLYDAKGLKVAEDGGGFPDASIRYRAPRDGLYVIAVTCVGNVRLGGARFTVTVREQ